MRLGDGAERERERRYLAAFVRSGSEIKRERLRGRRQSADALLRAPRGERRRAEGPGREGRGQRL